MNRCEWVLLLIEREAETKKHLFRLDVAESDMHLLCPSHLWCKSKYFFFWIVQNSRFAVLFWIVFLIVGESPEEKIVVDEMIDFFFCSARFLLTLASLYLNVEDSHVFLVEMTSQFDILWILDAERIFKSRIHVVCWRVKPSVEVILGAIY